MMEVFKPKNHVSLCLESSYVSVNLVKVTCKFLQIKPVIILILGLISISVVFPILFFSIDTGMNYCKIPHYILI